MRPLSTSEGRLAGGLLKEQSEAVLRQAQDGRACLPPACPSLTGRQGTGRDRQACD